MSHVRTRTLSRSRSFQILRTTTRAAGLVLSLSLGMTLDAAAMDRVTLQSGIVESNSRTKGVQIFRGIPFAAAPIGELRWQAPQPVKPWRGVRKAERFGASCMQPLVYADVIPRADRTSEDCLYLNVWTSAKSSKERLPVLVYFYGGGYVVGDASEARYDGASMARAGIVTVTVNYRLGVFGFFAHPELSKATSHGGSGNYALLDQAAALQWVHDNIAAFGGDPARITIGGESAGSISVSAQMASPLARHLIAGAIGESGSMMGALSPVPLAQGEAVGVDFAKHVGADSVAALRALPAATLLDAMRTFKGRFTPTIDGHFLPKPMREIYQSGEQAKVPLLAGSNSEEGNYSAVMGTEPATLNGYRNALTRLYGANAEAVFKLYPAASDGNEVLDAAQQLASDRFIAQSTWRWVDRAAASGGKPVYYYYYARQRPPVTAAAAAMLAERQKQIGTPTKPQNIRGAVHSSEIEYALGNLDTNPLYQWEPEDRLVSRTLHNYFINFIKTGNPNGVGLPAWSSYESGERMQIDVESFAIPNDASERGRAMDALTGAE